MLIRQLRLWTGLVLGLYTLLHFSNHMLGLLSLETMEGFRQIVYRIWSNPIGGSILYGSLLLHFLLALWSLYERSHLQLKVWEMTQLVSGLFIPPLLAAHVIATRGRSLLFDIEVTYPQVVTALWTNPWDAMQQTILLLIVWGHLVMGIHFWLRIKPWYPQAVPLLYPLAVLVPILALLGFARSGLTVTELASTPGWTERLFAEIRAAPEQQLVLQKLESVILALMGALLLLTLLARQTRRVYRNRHGVYRLIYPSGRTVEAHVGATMLEAIRTAGIPHAAVCGGRGRCTTCRVRVGPGKEDLDPPNETEKKALRRIGAPPSVRLACQVRPRRDLAITPLLLAAASPQAAWRIGGFRGSEQRVAVLFLDIRGSTSLAERLLPYDVVFILNQFFAEMTTAIKETGGHYTHFIGDGLMALYGLESGVEAGCREAIKGAVEMLKRLEVLNRGLEFELGRPLRIGIGIHSGDVIVGDMGPPESPTFTAIGDTVNIAARLEQHCKTYDCNLVVSALTAQTAGIDLVAYPRRLASVRGRTGSLWVYVVSDLDQMPNLEST